MAKSKNKNKDKKQEKNILSTAVNIILILAVLTSLGIDTLLIIKTLENHNKEEALFSMDYYKKEETYKAFNDVFNFYSGRKTKAEVIDLGKLVRKHNGVNKKNIYQVIVTLDNMKFLLKDDIDYSKYEQCIVENYYDVEIKYDKTTNLVNEISLTKVDPAELESCCGCSE